VRGGQRYRPPSGPGRPSAAPRRSSRPWWRLMGGIAPITDRLPDGADRPV